MVSDGDNRDSGNNILLVVTTYPSGDTTAAEIAALVDGVFSTCIFQFTYGSHTIYFDGCTSKS